MQLVLTVRAIGDVRHATAFMRERILAPYLSKIKHLERVVRELKRAETMGPSRRIQVARQRIAELEAELAAKQ